MEVSSKPLSHADNCKVVRMLRYPLSDVTNLDIGGPSKPNKSSTKADPPLVVPAQSAVLKSPQIENHGIEVKFFNPPLPVSVPSSALKAPRNFNSPPNFPAIRHEGSQPGGYD